jgi:hypothetical protein
VAKKFTGEINHMSEIVTCDAKGEGQGEGQQNPFAEYNNRSFQSYVKNGFPDKIPHGVEAPDTRMKRFISRVDMTKGFERKIMTMTRLKTRNYLSEDKRNPEKEFLVYQEEWVGKNWLAEKLCCQDNFEGVYTEVGTAPEVRFNNENGRSEVVGQKLAGGHQLYYIPFSKERVDEIIAKSDSDKYEIDYIVKSGPRRDHFTYEEFVNYSWAQLETILLYDGGVVAARADRSLQNSGKVLTANNLNFKPS